MRLLLLLAAACLGTAADDPADTRYLIAQPATITDYPPVAEVVDADFVVVPLYLLPQGPTFVKQLDSLRHTRQAILDAFRKDMIYQLSPIGQASLPADPGAPPMTTSAPPGSSAAYLVVHSGAGDPERIEADIHQRLAGFDSESCHLVLERRRLALLDPERFRRELLVKLEKYVELNRIATPRPSKVIILGLEHGLTATEMVDGRHILIAPVFQLRFEETN